MIFDDPLQISINDPDHSISERRFITFGTSDKNRLLIVAHTFRDDKIRIITARKPTRTERRAYEKGDFYASRIRFYQRGTREIFRQS